MLNRSTWYFQWSLESVGLSVQEKWLEIDFQDGNCGGQLGFSIGIILAVFDRRPHTSYQVSGQLDFH